MPISSPTSHSETDSQLRQFMIRRGLAQPGSDIGVAVLPGGVSCDVWKVEADGRTLCVKRALPRLRVAKLWEAPVTRSEAEWNWLNFAHTVVPASVPHALAHDIEAGMIAIEYLDPQQYPVWKQQLLAGAVEPDVAEAVGRVVSRIHAASAGNNAVANQFRTREAFYALRIEPYFIEAARRNPDIAAPLHRLAELTLEAEIALVHGDVSPKNILVGPEGPVILDAETAWFGEPAFDTAFCLSHLLLKCVAHPQFTNAYLSCFDSFSGAYLAGVVWEGASGLESRAARLLPALLLARVDGKSPVDYLAPHEQSFVRSCATELILDPFARLCEIGDFWNQRVKQFSAEPPQGG